MQRRVAFLLVLALVLATVATSIVPATPPRAALASQDASPAAAPALAATPVAPPQATPVPVVLPTAAELGLVFPAGIDVTPLAVGTIDQLPPDAMVLRLERVTVPAGDELATRTPSAPELLFGEFGTATIVDAFGLSAPLSAGGQAMLTAGSAYTLRNTSSGPATLLRLGLGSAATDPAAQVLLESQLSAAPAAPARLVLALSSWQPGSDTGAYTAVGPIGLLLNSGTLTISSPSGLEAPLGPGQGLIFPAGVPQRERNAGSEPAQALLIAVAPMGQPAVAAVPTSTPVPTATPEPTATPLPTSTPEPTATALPTSTPLPTATPEPTPTPVPTATPTPTPPPEPTLYEAGPNGGFEAWGNFSGWTVLDGELISDGSNCTSLVAPVDLSNVRDYAVEAEIQVIAASDVYGIGSLPGGTEVIGTGADTIDRSMTLKPSS